MRKGECMNSRCSFRHILGTKRPPPNDTTKSDPKASPDDASHRTHNESVTTSNNSSNSSPDHFLEMIRLVKAEFIKEMDVRLERMSCQMNQNTRGHMPQHSQPVLPQNQQTPGGHLSNSNPNHQMQQSQIHALPPAIYPSQIHNQQQSLTQQPLYYREQHGALQTPIQPQLMQANQSNNQAIQRHNQTQNQVQPIQHHQQIGRTILPNTATYSQAVATQNQQTQQTNQATQNYHQHLLPAAVNQVRPNQRQNQIC